jgi:hypothetical protein
MKRTRFRVVVAAVRHSCYGCSVAPSAFGVFALKPRCSHATASRRHAERSHRRACLSVLPIFTWTCDRLASCSFAAGCCVSMGLHRSSNRPASRSIAPAKSSRLYSGGTWSSVRARAVDCRLYHQRWSDIQSSCACLVFADGLPLHRLLSKRTSGGIVPERAMTGWI